MTAAPASVGIELQHSQISLHLQLARLLRQRHGSRIHLYLRSEAERRGFARRAGPPFWDSLGVSGAISRAIREVPPPEDAVIARARAFEARIGETIHRLVVANRQLGRGYSPGSFKLPRPRLYTEASYIQVLHAFNEALGFWDREIADKGLDLIIDAGKEAACMARAHTIAYRWLTFVRYGSHRAWAVDEYQSDPLIQAAYERLESWPPARLSAGYAAADTKRARILRRMSLAGHGAFVARALPRLAYRRLAGDVRARQTRVRDLLLFPLEMRAAYRDVRRLSRTRLADLAGRPFAYFPLQKEPEQALLQAAPEQTNQQAVAMALSRELPAGVRLGVREHFAAVGRRPRDFYAQLAALPNVVFLDLDEDPIAIARAAAVTATIAGTAAYEAATLGRPAIVFSEHVGCNFLPHVMTVRAEGDLGAFLGRVFSGDIDLAQARDDGARYQAAVAAATFDMGAFGRSVTEEGATAPEAAETAYRGLLRSLEAAAPAPRAARVG